MAESPDEPVRALLESLLAKYGLNGLQVQRLSRIRNKVEGYTGVRHMFALKNVACVQLYGAKDHPHQSYTPELVRAFTGEDGARRFTNLTTSCFPHAKAHWQQLLANHQRPELAGHQPTFPNGLEHLDLLLGTIVDSLRHELGLLGMADNPVNLNRLLTLRMALGAKLVVGSALDPHLSAVNTAWLKSGVALPVLLYSLGAVRKQWPQPGLTQPLIPLEDALAADGIPFERLRTLYPEPAHGSYF